MSDLDGLVQSLRAGKALIVCGAGVTRAATSGAAPGWLDLILLALNTVEEAAKPDPSWMQAVGALLKSASATNWLLAANMIQEKLGGAGGEAYAEFLRSSVGVICATDDKVPAAILALGAPIATTNYDNCLCAEAGGTFATWRDPRQVAAILLGNSRDIWHVHGHWKDAESVIFSGNDYARVRSASKAQFLQNQAAFDRSLIFVGCSADGLNDANVGGLLGWFAENFKNVSSDHYVLVTDGQKDAAWPNGVTPIVFGVAHEELSGFLQQIAPPHARGDNPYRLPPDPKMVGRENRLEELVELILGGTQPIIIPGGPSMGKTTLALAAAHDGKVASKFPRQLFVALDVATEGRAILTCVAQAVGVSAAGADDVVLTGIRNSLAATPTLLILDNGETPLAADRDRAVDYFASIADIPNVCSLITIRGDTPSLGRGVIIDDIAQLPFADARLLFRREAATPANKPDDPDLKSLLDVLEGHPLSIKLLAAHARGSPNLGLLTKEWRTKRAALLQDGASNHRLRNTRASLALSLARCSDAARRLFALLAYLPIGLAESDIDRVLPGDGVGAALELRRLRLVVGDDSPRLRVLAPLRESARLDCKADDGDRRRLFSFVLDLTAQANAAGTSAWAERRDRVLQESGNFDAIVTAALEAGWTLAELAGAMQGLRELSVFLGVGSTQSFELGVTKAAAAKDLTNQARLIGNLGDVLDARSDYEAALNHYNRALPLYKEVGNSLGEANCIQNIGRIALARSDYNAARQAFEKTLTLYRQLDEPVGEANSLHALGQIALEQNDFDVGRQHLEQALPLYREADVVLGEANCIHAIGNIAFRCEENETAQDHFKRALKLYEQVGDRSGEANSIHGIGKTALARGEVEVAKEEFERALSMYQQLGAVVGEGACFMSLGQIALAHGDAVTARNNLERAVSLFERVPEPGSIGWTYLLLAEAAIDDEEARLFLSRVRAAWASISRQDWIDEHL